MIVSVSALGIPLGCEGRCHKQQLGENRTSSWGCADFYVFWVFFPPEKDYKNVKQKYST